MGTYQLECCCGLRAMSRCQEVGCREQLLGRLSVWFHRITECQESHMVYMYIHSHQQTFILNGQRGEPHEVIGAICASVRAEYVPVLACVTSRACILMCVFYTGVCVRNYWEYKPNLATGWTSGHRPAAASPLLSYWIWKA